MKNLLFTFLAITMAICFSGCKEKQEEGPQKWEYRTLISTLDYDSYRSRFGHGSIEIPTDEMNKLGDEGWELVSVYTRIETEHPNYGNEKYVTGLQPNTRTLGVFYVFKRPKIEPKDKSDKSGGDSDTIIVDTIVADSVSADSM